MNISDFLKKSKYYLIGKKENRKEVGFFIVFPKSFLLILLP